MKLELTPDDMTHVAIALGRYAQQIHNLADESLQRAESMSAARIYRDRANAVGAVRYRILDHLEG
jgi:hypothetical protein